VSEPDWWREHPGAPIEVPGGLVARSARGAIGEQWWSRRFIEVLESFSLGGRLTRGRAYARKGQVVSLEVAPGLVTAVVQGTRVQPYDVTVGLTPFTKLIWAKAEVVLAEQAVHAARLLAGDFPPELEPVFAGIGAPLFPRRLTDLDLRCTCPDQTVPCKHIAAVFYLLAERFDDDPFLVLRWRGRGREELLARLRELRGESTPAAPLPDPEPDEPRVLPPVLTAALALTSAPPVVPSSDGFWTAGETLPLPVRPDLPVDLLLRSLPDPGTGLGRRRLIDQLTPLYQQFR
jgi:uncharacterized Zn finger protein